MNKQQRDRAQRSSLPIDPVSVGWRIAIIVFLGGIGGGLVFPILPILGVRLGISAALIGLILSANRVTRLMANLMTGQLVDKLGGKGPLTIGLLIEGASTFLYSVALGQPHPGMWFLLGRALWGVGSSFLIVGGMAMALKVSHHDDRGRVTSFVRSAQSIGMPAGMVVGGFIAGFWSDNAAFLTASSLTLVAAAIAVLIVPGVAAYGRGAQTSGDPPDAHEEKKRAINERSGWTIFLSLLKNHDILLVWMVNFLIFFSLRGLLTSTLVIVIDERHIQLFGMTAQPTASVLMAVMLAFSAGVTMVVGRLLDRTSSRILLVIPAIVCQIAGFAVLATAHSLAPMIVSLGALGLAMGGTATPLLTLMGDLVPAATYGRAVGFYQVFGDGGGSLGPILGVWAGLHLGFQSTYIAVGLLTVMFLPFVIWLWRVERRALAQA